MVQICTREDPRAPNRRGIRVPEDCPQEFLDLIEMMLSTNSVDRPSAEYVLDALLALRDAYDDDGSPRPSHETEHLNPL